MARDGIEPSTFGFSVGGSSVPVLHCAARCFIVKSDFLAKQYLCGTVNHGVALRL
jgi:hypothetical protein